MRSMLFCGRAPPAGGLSWVVGLANATIENISDRAKTASSDFFIFLASRKAFLGYYFVFRVRCTLHFSDTDKNRIIVSLMPGIRRLTAYFELGRLATRRGGKTKSMQRQADNDVRPPHSYAVFGLLRRSLRPSISR